MTEIQNYQKAEKWKWAYFGGIMDGEGTITITQSRGNYKLLVRIGNTSENLIAVLAKTFDGLGGTTRMDDHHFKQGHKMTYTISWSGRNAQKLLSLLVPFLLIKKRQALIALAFPILTKGQDMDDQTLNLKISLFQEMRSLNE